MMVAVGKESGRFIIGSGKGVNKGRIAGGADDISMYRGSVFAKRAYSNPAQGNRPGGLIDKRQQVDPESTLYGHPFDGSNYRGSATNKLQEPVTYWNVIHPFNPLGHVPEIPPNQHGNFFHNKVEPEVKTVFGANKTGKRSDTAFHPDSKVLVYQRPSARSSKSTEKVINKARTPSFETIGNMWNNSNHSFVAGHPNTVTGQIGTGRWSTVKRSVV